MPNLEELVETYDRDHRHPANRLLHFVGIPTITLGVALLLVAPVVGLGLIVLGFLLQFVGHAVEGKKPTFTQHPRYMAVGAVWYARQLAGLLGWNASK